jgi:hypothetical protein
VFLNVQSNHSQLSEHGGEAPEVNILMIEDTNEFEQVQFEQNFMKGFSQMLLKIQESLHLPPCSLPTLSFKSPFTCTGTRYSGLT